MKAKFLFNLFSLMIFARLAVAQPLQKLIDVQVTPAHEDWTYKLGENTDFLVQILKNGQPLSNIKIRYEIGMERMPASTKEEKILKSGHAILKGGTLKRPGFLRCHVWVDYQGRAYDGWGTAGYEPEKIIPTVKMPVDFDKFWTDAKSELANLPIDAIVTLKPELCTADINVYHVNLQNIKMSLSWRGSSRFYGMLSVPKKPGKYPVILGVPGAGVRAYGRDDKAAKGVIVFNVGIHGIPVDLDFNVYKSLATSSLAGYERYNLQDKDLYYYKRVYMGCVRAIDFIYTLPAFDGENLAVIGGSQGGALSIVT